MGAWDRDDLRDVEAKELEALTTLLGFRPEPEIKTPHEIASRKNFADCMDHQNIIIASAHQDSLSTPWVLTDPEARKQLINHLLSDKNLLALTYLHADLNERAPEGSLAKVPALVRQMISVVADAMNNNPTQAEEIFQAASRRLRFATIPTPPDSQFVHEFVTQNSPYIFGFNWVSDREMRSLEHGNLLDASVPKDYTLLILGHDNTKEGTREPRAFISGEERQLASKSWLYRMFPAFTFYRIAEDITTSEEFGARLGHLKEAPVLAKI